MRTHDAHEASAWSPVARRLPRRFTPANAGQVVNSTTPWSALPPPPASIAFRASGRGEASVAASLTFVPAQLLPYASYRGLWVQRVIQLAGGASGNLAAVPLGATVDMVIQVCVWGGGLIGLGFWVQDVWGFGCRVFGV